MRFYDKEIATALLTFLTASCALGTPLDTARKYIEDAYTQTNLALTRKDVVGYMAYYTPDFQGESADGQVGNLAQIKRNMVSLFSSASHCRNSTTVLSFRLQANEAFVKVREQATVNFMRGGNLMEFREDEVDLDTWVSAKSEWKEKRAVVLADKKSIRKK